MLYKFYNVCYPLMTFPSDTELHNCEAKKLMNTDADVLTTGVYLYLFLGSLILAM